MLNTPAFLFLTLYIAIIVVSYYVVRRGWLRAYPVFVIGGTVTALVGFAFSLARGNMLLQAAIVGPFTGFIFAALMVVFATFYRHTAPSKAAERRIGVPQDSEALSIEQAHNSAA